MGTQREWWKRTWLKMIRAGLKAPNIMQKAKHWQVCYKTLRATKKLVYSKIKIKKKKIRGSKLPTKY